MTFRSFKTLADVADSFDIIVNENSFMDEKELIIPTDLFHEIDENLHSKWSYVSEDARCETIIAP